MTRSRVLALAMVTLSSVLVVASLIFDVSVGELQADFARLPSGVLGHLATFATAAIGFGVATRRPTNPIGWILSAIGLVNALSSGASSYATYGIVVDPASVPASQWAAWIANWIGRVVSAGTLVAYLLFPTGRLLSPRWRATLLLPALVAIGFTMRAFVPGPMTFLGVENPVGLGWVPRSVDDGGLAGLSLLGGNLLAFVSLGLRYRRAASVEREQIKWLVLPVLALVAALVGTVISLVTGTYGDPLVGATLRLLYPLAAAALPVSMGIAILRYRLYDIDLLINRTLVYGATSAAIAATFFAGIIALQALLRPLTAGSDLAVAASTVVSFALFQPVRRRVQRTVDARFDRTRYDAARTFELFADRMRDEVDVEALRAELVDAVRQTMAPAHASLWLRERAGSSGR